MRTQSNLFSNIKNKYQDVLFIVLIISTSFDIDAVIGSVMP